MTNSIWMYLTAMSAVSLHSLVSNIQDVARISDPPIIISTIGQSWTYKDDLSVVSPSCSSSSDRQSPIDIDTNMLERDSRLRLELTAYDKPITGVLVNQWPTFELKPFSYKWSRPIAGIAIEGPMRLPKTDANSSDEDNKYVLAGLHFHWSQDDRVNKSLHRINGRSYPMEIHFVHVNGKYGNYDEAKSLPDGLLILAVMVVPSVNTERYIIDKIIDRLGNITQHGDQVPINEDSTYRMLLPADTSRFYLYRGSLEAPPCYESVRWCIFADPLRVGAKQIKRLQQFQFHSIDTRTGETVNWAAQRRRARAQGTTRNTPDDEMSIEVNCNDDIERKECFITNASTSNRDTTNQILEQNAKTLDQTNYNRLQRYGKRIPGLGIILCLISSLFFGTAGFLVKVTRSVSGVQIAIYRCLFQLVWYGIAVLATRGSFWPHRGEYWGTALRAIPGGLSITLIYAAIRLIPLGDATTIRFSLPIWALCIGAVLVNETCTPLKICAIFVSLAGVALIAKPDECMRLLSWLTHIDYNYTEKAIIDSTIDLDVRFRGSLIALGSSITLALSIVGLRMCQRTDTQVIIFWLSVSCVVLSLAFHLIFSTHSNMLPSNWPDVMYLLLNGACGTAGQYFLTLSLKLEESGPISLARTFDIIVAFAYSVMVLRESISVAR
ncbi:Carbonic anhydrase 6 [Fragariocoptes setiger]|uniref:carbonic anhydrase n=1 Tax=Fragariocoptes setiger TaxID=1670756 RepID=A0ABQ7S8Y0_9ACAR|nr:Carbonic anhydrase 6 [Fragariocoptes setiger]